MDPAKILQIITNSTWMVTKLVGSEPLEFDKQKYMTEVLENTTPELLLQLKARAQPNVIGPVEFHIIGGNDERYFSLNSQSGILTLNSPLDFERKQQYHLVVEVRAGEASSEAQVDIQVLNQNEHYPVFPRELHETQITEEDDRHLPKTILTQVTATDSDAGKYGQLRYSLSGDGVNADRTRSSFSIDQETGAIHLLMPLDRDPPNGRSQWRLKVKATDGEFEAYTSVHVNLKDINDNAPFFPVSTINATISENTPKGNSVAQVSATDNDDPHEGQNARLVYSLEKNVIDEASGRPIFGVNNESGLISTSLCCLDREKTNRYAIQVVATDGGGLKGTGTVLVEVSDVNDVPPRFSKSEWTLDVSEELTPDEVLATLSVIDQDITNNFTFKVVPGSGRGWQMFRVEGRKSGTKPGGDLHALQPLDYENQQHREGFKFKVQVSDMGDDGWSDMYHVDSTWVTLNVVDANDNSPIFNNDQAELTLPEDTITGFSLASFIAHDIDGGGKSRVHYSVSPSSDPGGLFGVDQTGTVRLIGSLDRERNPFHKVLILAADDGIPSRTSTATLVVKVTDVNDNAPFLSKPREVQVMENAEPQIVAKVKLDDPDDWGLGHGPPFSIHLDPRASQHIKAAIKVELDHRGDEGRGIGVISTKIPLDREERRALLVPLIVGDSGSPSFSSTVTLTIHVADLNDNPMAPASKIITVYTVKPQISPVPLGRIYVKDPDDWDAASKTYRWRGTQHPNFLLNSKTGDLSMRSGAKDDSYDLAFSVSDETQSQTGVSANVTVKVKSLSQRDIKAATPITLAIDPYRIVKEQKNSMNLLEYLERLVRKWVVTYSGFESNDDEDVDAVAVQQVKGSPNPFTRIWFTSPSRSKNLHHIFLHRLKDLEHAIGVNVIDVGVGPCNENSHDESSVCLDGCSSRVSIGTGFSIIDANTSAIVGPWVDTQNECSCQVQQVSLDDICTPDTCFNGSRCLPTDTGSRCICPHGTWGSRCKILLRSFDGDEEESGIEGGGGSEIIGDNSTRGGWAWVPSIPSCAEVHISLEFFTSMDDTTLLYSGPDHVTMPSSNSLRDMISLELREGRPSLTLDLGTGASSLYLNASYTLSDSTWHRLDVIWKDQLVEMIVDMCSGESLDGASQRRSLSNSSNPHTASSSSNSPQKQVPPDAHTCRGASALKNGAKLLNTGKPLQLGGISHRVPSHSVHGWPYPLLGKSLKGCIRHLRVNGELIDLGKNILSHKSSPGCSSVNCEANGLNCGTHGSCHGSPEHLRCECQLGWSGDQCSMPTTPSAFQLNSYVKLALSFTPLAYTTTLHLRFRTHTDQGELVVLSSQHGRDRLSLELINGRLCLGLQLHPDTARSLCLTGSQLTDGQWHSVFAQRFGSATFLSVDDGEGDLYNASVSLEGRQLLEIDKQEGVHIGGSPEYVGLSVFKIHGDYHDGCIDDVRISGKSVPLPPAMNGTPWGQASMYKGVDKECTAPPACANVSCRTPLRCIDTWGSYHCGCGEGRIFLASQNICEDKNECVWEPCLNGGTCHNKLSDGYICSCPDGFNGQHCHLPYTADPSFKLSLGALTAIVVWSSFLLLLVCAFLLHQHRRSALRRGMAGVKENIAKCKEQHSSCSPCSQTPNILEFELLKPPKANGQPAWNKNPDIADVDNKECSIDVGQTCSFSNVYTYGGGTCQETETTIAGSNKESRCNPQRSEDLRNYAYASEVSSPGSLSSCKS